MSRGVPLRLVILAATFAVAVAAAPAGASASTTAPPGSRLQDDDRRVTFTGAWVHMWSPRYSGSSVRRSRRDGAKVSARFDGTAVGLRAPRGPKGGIAAIYLDGERVGTVSLYSSWAETSTVRWASGELPDGEHEIVVKATGEQEPASGGAYVWFDAFEITGAVIKPAAKKIVQSSDERVYRKGSWRTRKDGDASGNSSKSASSKSASIRFDFDGTGVTWIGRKSVDHGLAAVYLDGERVATVGGWRNPSREKRVLWSISGLKDKKHRLVIKPLAKPAFEGKGTKIDVDGFIVKGKTLYAPRPTPFDYPWKTYIVIDKSDYRLYWVKNKTLLKAYPIAHGKRWGYTPHRVWRVGAKYHTSPGSVYGPRKMRMFKRVSTRYGYRYVFTAYAIHGTNQPWVIGTMASHGCIRMYNKDVLELYPQVPMNTMVVTRG